MIQLAASVVLMLCDGLQVQGQQQQKKKKKTFAKLLLNE